MNGWRDSLRSWKDLFLDTWEALVECGEHVWEALKLLLSVLAFVVVLVLYPVLRIAYKAYSKAYTAYHTSTVEAFDRFMAKAERKNRRIDRSQLEWWIRKVENKTVLEWLDLHPEFVTTIKAYTPDGYEFQTPREEVQE